MTYIRSLGLKQVMELIEVAVEQEEKEHLFREYLAFRPHFTKDEYKSFNEYYEKHKAIKPSQVDTRSTDEIMAELNAIRV